MVAESRAKAHGSIKGTILGRIWLILEPFLNAAVYYFIFAVLLQFDRGMHNFVAYLVIGITFFSYLSRQLQAGSSIIQGGQNLVRSFNFPWASLVFSNAIRSFIDFMPTLVATLIFIIAVPPHALPSLTWLLFPFVFIMAIPFGIGLTFITACLTERIVDLKFIIPLLSRFWFYGSGVFWTVEMFANKPALQEVMMLNPGWVFLQMLRETLVYNEVPAFDMWLYLLAWSLGTFTLGFLLFWKNEVRFGRTNDK